MLHSVDEARHLQQRLYSLEYTAVNVFGRRFCIASVCCITQDTRCSSRTPSLGRGVRIRPRLLSFQLQLRTSARPVRPQVSADWSCVYLDNLNSRERPRKVTSAKGSVKDSISFLQRLHEMFVLLELPELCTASTKGLGT